MEFPPVLIGQLELPATGYSVVRGQVWQGGGGWVRCTVRRGSDVVVPDFGLPTRLTEDDYVPVEFVWRTGQMTTISLFCQYGGYTSMPTSINTKLSAEWFGDIIVQ